MYPGLTKKSRSGVSTTEARGMMHIEDPFDTARNLSCVLAAGHNDKLRRALLKASRPASDPYVVASRAVSASRPSDPYVVASRTVNTWLAADLKCATRASAPPPKAAQSKSSG